MSSLLNYISAEETVTGIVQNRMARQILAIVLSSTAEDGEIECVDQIIPRQSLSHTSVDGVCVAGGRGSDDTNRRRQDSMLSPDITGLPCQSPLLEQGWGPSSGPGDHPIGSPTGPGDPFLGGLQPDHLISLPGTTEHLPGLREAHCASETAAQENYSLPVEVDYGNNFILDTTVHNELSVPRPISLERTLLKEDFVSNNSSMSREQRIPAISNLYSHSPSEDVVNESTDQFKSSTVPDSTVSSHQTYSTIVNNNEPPTNDGNPFNFQRGVSLNYKRLVSGCTQTSQPGTPIHFQRSSSLIERSRPVSLISGCTQTDIETENSWAFCRSPSLDQYYDAFEIPSPSRTSCLVQGEPDWSPPEQHSSAENSIPCTTDNVIPREWLKREDVPSHSEQCVMETLAIQNTDCIVGSPDGHLMETTVLHHNENTPWTPRTLDDDCVQDWLVKNSSSVGEEHSIPSSSRGLEDTEQLMSLPRGRCLTPGVSDSDEDDEDDPDVKQRLAELASVLAESLGRRCSEENMGCKVNLAFDDTESTEECRGLDITDPDCDNQPWYFGRAQEPDWEAVPSDRPVSLACTSPPEFLRNCTTRATVGDRPHSLVALSRSQKVRSTLAGLPRRSREVLAQDMRVLKKLARRVSWASHHGETRQSG
uniref:Uncharacterized protein n=1 Tax=Timema poppense TaxID=170557 RepID=A0A7R9DFC0_TIMPO|nr:unnamed protein product [Timema poppensis]